MNRFKKWLRKLLGFDELLEELKLRFEFQEKINESRHKEITELLEKILVPALNKEIERAKEIPIPVSRRAVPWSVRKSFLEAEDLRKLNAEKEEYWKKQGGIKVEKI